PPEPLQLGFVEARADLAGIPQLAALGVVHAQLERAEPPGARASPLRPAADHQLLALRVLDLQPAPVALAGQVARVEPLGDDALQALLARGGEQRAAVALVVGGHAPVLAVEPEREQVLAALAVGQVEQRMAVEP